MQPVQRTASQTGFDFWSGDENEEISDWASAATELAGRLPRPPPRNPLVHVCRDPLVCLPQIPPLFLQDADDWWTDSSDCSTPPTPLTAPTQPTPQTLQTPESIVSHEEEKPKPRPNSYDPWKEEFLEKHPEYAFRWFTTAGDLDWLPDWVYEDQQSFPRGSTINYRTSTHKTSLKRERNEEEKGEVARQRRN